MLYRRGISLLLIVFTLTFTLLIGNTSETAQKIFRTQLPEGSAPTAVPSNLQPTSAAPSIFQKTTAEELNDMKAHRTAARTRLLLQDAKAHLSTFVAQPHVTPRPMKAINITLESESQNYAETSKMDVFHRK